MFSLRNGMVRLSVAFIFVALVLAAMCALIGNEALTIRVSPRVVMAGNHTLRIICKVTRDADNRWLDMGIVDYRRHGVQLDGLAAPITHTFEVEWVPCGVSTAFCYLESASHQPLRRALDFEVAGCEQ